MEVQGKNNSLTITDTKVTVTRKVAPFQPALKKDILITSITAITFQPAGLLQPGYIIFSLTGGQEPGSGSIAAALNDNAVLFNRKQENDFLQAKEHIEKLISSVNLHRYF